MNVKSLIEDVITDLANNCTLESISSKVQVISRLLKNDKFKNKFSLQIYSEQNKSYAIGSEDSNIIMSIIFFNYINFWQSIFKR